MKTKLFLAAVVFAANCTIANGQVLGGNVVGGTGGALGGGLGGMRDIGAAGHGNASGAFGADLDSGSLRRSTSDITGRAAQRTRSSVNATRERTRSTVSSAGNATNQAIATTHDQAIGATSAAKANAEWGATSTLDAGQGATTMAGDAQGAANAVATTASTAKAGGAEISPAGDGASPASVSGGFAERASAELVSENDGMPLDASGEAAANGDASASKEGVHARGSANAFSDVAVAN